MLYARSGDTSPAMVVVAQQIATKSSKTLNATLYLLIILRYYHKEADQKLALLTSLQTYMLSKRLRHYNSGSATFAARVTVASAFISSGTASLKYTLVIATVSTLSNVSCEPSSDTDTL